MNDNTVEPITDARLLAAMKAVSPPLEKLMEDRLALRHDVNRVRAELEQERQRTDDLRRLRDLMIPRYIAIAKAVTLAAATIILIALAVAFFTGLFEIKTTASLFASLLLPLWLVEIAERRFGRWELSWVGGESVRFRHAASVIAE